MKFGTFKKYYVKLSLNTCRMTLRLIKHNHNFYLHIICFLISFAFLQQKRKNIFNKASKCLRLTCMVYNERKNEQAVIPYTSPTLGNATMYAFNTQNNLIKGIHV